MQAYAIALNELGHFALIITASAQEYWQRQLRRAQAAHLGQQKLLGSKVEFDMNKFKNQFPSPSNDDPDVAIGHEGQAGYTNGFLRYRNSWFMDVGGARGKSPFNVFHVGVLDGDHHCHASEMWLVDAESKEGTPRRFELWK